MSCPPVDSSLDQFSLACTPLRISGTPGSSLTRFRSRVSSGMGSSVAVAGRCSKSWGSSGAGYGLIDDAVIEALKLAARSDALLLDPVYTGKGMKGLIALSRLGAFDGETVVFLHTGGAQGLFGYQGELEGKLG